MKRVKGLDKESGTLVGMVHAASVTEGSRYAYKYGCVYDDCGCTFHWRRAVQAKGNTDPIPATFVKNRSSSHKDGCPADFEAIHRENSEYTTLKDGAIHVRVNFPLGSAPVDRFPKRGYLSEELLKAALNQKDIQPFGSLKELVKFIDKNFGGIESDAAAEIMVNYQGRAVEWGKLYKGSDRYEKLYARSRDFKYQDEGKDTPPIITVVRPVTDLGISEKGHRKFGCEEQRVKIEGRWQRVIPVIVCDKFNTDLAHAIEKNIEDNETMLIAARPFHPGMRSKPAQFGELRVSMFIHNASQLTVADPSLWRVPSYGLAKQMDLFPSAPQQAMR